jgi:mRNA (2'-O-methyladenosine-N6-)-methyltransferase
MGRKLLKEWGFRRAEDIIWLQKSKNDVRVNNVDPDCKFSSTYWMKNKLFKNSKEHFLMGMKGTVRRNVDNHFINSNIDTDIIVTDLAYKVDFPSEIFHLIERLCLGRRRLFLKFDG